MSVLLTMADVKATVQTQLEATNVSVKKGLNYRLIITHVKVPEMINRLVYTPCIMVLKWYNRYQ